jgi:hypothetical protein
VPGWATAWLDNAHLLVQYYVLEASAGSAIIDPAGLKLSTPASPGFSDPFQVVGPDSIYDPERNTIFSVSTGIPTWITVTPSTGVGAVAGSHVVFASGNQVLSQPL